MYLLLWKSEKLTFVGIGSPMASIGGMEQRPYSGVTYGPSKAMLHWMVRKIHFKNKDFVSFVADPGFTATDMGTAPARKVGLEKPFQTVEALYTRRSHGTLRQRPNFLGG
ncbi:hypothetical protein EYZ11_002975 [Aspergillus tanneri]|uniref:Ketoreductase (KR) domain-containing protein n=1 Tax=Aspergillus tanneri TaxID=1220188 RepID=A0A4S3JPK0_9EURO|nr:hypothetical protein EYZ11_002975 [Aspergillus tanneri]